MLFVEAVFCAVPRQRRTCGGFVFAAPAGFVARSLRTVAHHANGRKQFAAAPCVRCRRIHEIELRALGTVDVTPIERRLDIAVAQ